MKNSTICPTAEQDMSAHWYSVNWYRAIKWAFIGTLAFVFLPILLCVFCALTLFLVLYSFFSASTFSEFGKVFVRNFKMMFFPGWI